MLRSVLNVRFALVLTVLAILAIVLGGSPWGPG